MEPAAEKELRAGYDCLCLDANPALQMWPELFADLSPAGGNPVQMTVCGMRGPLVALIPLSPI